MEKPRQPKIRIAMARMLRRVADKLVPVPDWFRSPDCMPMLITLGYGSKAFGVTLKVSKDDLRLPANRFCYVNVQPAVHQLQNEFMSREAANGKEQIQR